MSSQCPRASPGEASYDLTNCGKQEEDRPEVAISSVQNSAVSLVISWAPAQCHWVFNNISQLNLAPATEYGCPFYADELRWVGGKCFSTSCIVHGQQQHQHWTLMPAQIPHLIQVVFANANGENRIVLHQEQRVTALSMTSPRQIIQVLVSIAQLYIISLKEPQASQVDHVHHTVGHGHGDCW